MLPPMPLLTPPLVALAGAALASLACDARGTAGGMLGAAGCARFEEVAADEAQRWLERDGALLLQARGERSPARALRGARIVPVGAPLAPPAAGHTIVVVAEEPELGLELAAALAREGAARVGFVAGGLPSFERGRESEPGAPGAADGREGTRGT